MSNHAKLSPSSAHRWAKCPGSINAENTLPAYQQNIGSSYAQEGTIAHDLAENCLNNMANPFDMTENLEMAHYVQEYIDYIDRFDGIKHIEVRVKLDRWIKGSFGTSDCVIEDDTTLRVIDLKYGMGKKVYAKNNLQGALYALGSLDTFHSEDVTHVCIAIVQPRLDHIDEWTITVNELLSIGEWLKERSLLTEAEDAPRIPGEEQCQFCKARPVCPTLKKETEKVTMAAFDNIDIENLDNDAISQALEKAPMIRAWLSAVEDYALRELEHDKKVPGFKLVKGRGSRRFNASDDLETMLSEKGIDLYERKIKSPAKLEKELKKDKGLLSDFIESIEGKPVIAKESDKRKKIENTLDNFDDLS